MKRPVSKTWLIDPPATPIEHIVIIGAGIAGASTAHALAQRGLKVTVLDAAEAASGASGNHQGLLYAKITAADTPQNQLLRLAFPYAVHHLQHFFAKRDFWDECGLLQLAFNEAETKRQHALQQSGYAGISHWPAYPVATNSPWQQHSGLWWPQGAWVSPPLWVQALLSHSNIQLHTHQAVGQLSWQQDCWHIQTHTQTLQASHVIVCAGSHSDEWEQTQALNLKRIRGQVAYAESDPDFPITHAVSGQHYLTPAFENRHTFGASFVLHDTDTGFRVAEHQHNLDGLQQLSEVFSQIATQQNKLGRASIRADSIDHLPILGPVGKHEAMMQTYAKLSQDKHYPIDEKCPYHPNLWVNTAHGTRGMVTAPICAESLAQRLCQEDNILPTSLQAALHPNRLPIRQLIYGKS